MFFGSAYVTDSARAIGRGMLVLESGAIASTSATPNKPATTLIRYSIQPDGLKFYSPVASHNGSTPPQSWFDLLPTLTASGVVKTDFKVAAGHLSLVSLPASPQAAFYEVALQVSGRDVTLSVTHSAVFSERENVAFKALNIAFTESKGSQSLQVSGQLTLSLLGQDINLMPVLSEAGALIFCPTQPQSLEIASFGQLSIAQLSVGTDDDRWAELQALYTFDSPSGNVFLDSAGQSTGIALAGTVERVRGGISVSNSGPTSGPTSGSNSGLKSEPTSDVGITRLVNACKASNAITIAAWVKPTQALTKQSKRPARIVSLSKDLGERNFTLGQDIDEKGNNRYSVRLRSHKGYSIINWLLQNSWPFIRTLISLIARLLSNLFNLANPCNGTPAVVSEPFLLPQDQLSYVVFTRDRTGTGKIYINGVDRTDVAASADLMGAFGQWADSADFSLVLGNEVTGDRPWQGEFYEVAIYSRALSADEVLRTYYPDIQLEATLTLNRLPVPLNEPLRVTLSNTFADGAQIKVTQQATQQALKITPSLVLDEIDLEWRGTPTSAGNLVGSINATLWDNLLTLDTLLTADKLALSLPNAQRRSLLLKDAGSLTSKITTTNKPENSPPSSHLLGKIELTQLSLRVDRSENNPDWAFETDGKVTFATIPQPLKGPFSVDLLIESGKLWFGISPSKSLIEPLKLADGLSFASADLRFAREVASEVAGEVASELASESGRWQVQVDERGDRNGLHLPLFSKNLNLAAELLQTSAGKVLALTWTESTNGLTLMPLSQQLGKLNLLNFSLHSNPTGDPSRWHLVMDGEVPLGVDDSNSGELIPGAVLIFSTEAGEIVGVDSKPVQQPTKLQGKSSLRSLNESLFAGDLQSLDNSFLLTGRFDLFPNWSALQANAEADIKILADGQMQAQSPAEVSLPDFALIEPLLKLADGRLTLSGGWLGEAVVFTALQRANQTVWQGRTDLEIPFSLALGPIHDPRSGVKLVDRIQICQTPNCRQIMRAQVDIELSSAGFLARVNSGFTWQDERFIETAITVAEFSLFEPPATRNHLLGSIIEQVKAQADELFGHDFKPTYGYFFAISEGKPVVYLGDRTHPFDRALPPTVLPKVFKADTAVEVESFRLQQTAEGCCLSLDPRGRSPLALKASYLAFLQKLEAAPIEPGALTLVQSRIAERLPITLDSLLFYYYGLDADGKQINLQAGMRLRVDYQSYQFVHPADKTANSGFVGSGTAYYSLTSSGDEENFNTLSFDAFLSQIQPYVNTDIAKVGAGGSLDTFQAGYQHPYMRLIYPSQLASSQGALIPEQAAALVGATSLTALDQGMNVSTFYFRGRAAVVPEIAVVLQGKPLFIPIGTTLQQLMEQTLSVPSALPGKSLSASTGRPRLSRVVHDGVDNAPNYEFINLEEMVPIFDLPLVKGDRIDL